MAKRKGRWHPGMCSEEREALCKLPADGGWAASCHRWHGRLLLTLTSPSVTWCQLARYRAIWHYFYIKMWKEQEANKYITFFSKKIIKKYRDTLYTLYMIRNIEQFLRGFSLLCPESIFCSSEHYSNRRNENCLQIWKNSYYVHLNMHIWLSLYGVPDSYKNKA